MAKKDITTELIDYRKEALKVASQLHYSLRTQHIIKHALTLGEIERALHSAREKRSD